MTRNFKGRTLHLVICLVILNLLILFPIEIESKAQYVMPLLGGMKMSLPYDIANIFIRPISAVVSVFLSISMLCILLFGVITSPFGYMFGIPSRKYVLGGPIDVLHSQTASRSLDFGFLGLNNTFFDFIGSDTNQTFQEGEEEQSSSSSNMIPTFEDQVFYLLPPQIQKEDECKLLALCHAHNSISKLPTGVLKIVRLFSEKLIQLSSPQMEAIKTGMRNKEFCGDVYPNCKDSIYTILVKSVLGILPDFMKNHTHRRKRAMYSKRNRFSG